MANLPKKVAIVIEDHGDEVCVFLRRVTCTTLPLSHKGDAEGTYSITPIHWTPARYAAVLEILTKAAVVRRTPFAAVTRVK